MGDLIDRREAIEAVADYIHNVDIVMGNGTLSADDCIDAAESVLEDLPSAQPELVWCKDCKWYDPTHPYGTVIPDAFHCKANDRFYEASHFCGYGERREDRGPDEQETGEEEETCIGLSIHESSANNVEIPQTAYAETMENTGEMVNEDSTQVPSSSAPEPVRPLTPQEILLTALRDVAAESDRLFRIQKYKSMTNAAAMDAHAIEIGLVDPQNGGENGS